MAFCLTENKPTMPTTIKKQLAAACLLTAGMLFSPLHAQVIAPRTDAGSVISESESAGICRVLNLPEEECPEFFVPQGADPRAKWHEDDVYKNGGALDGFGAPGGDDSLCPKCALRSSGISHNGKACIAFNLKQPSIVSFEWRVISESRNDVVRYFDGDGNTISDPKPPIPVPATPKGDNSALPQNRLTANVFTSFLSGTGISWIRNEYLYSENVERTLAWCYMRNPFSNQDTVQGNRAHLALMRIKPLAVPEPVYGRAYFSVEGQGELKRLVIREGESVKINYTLRAPQFNLNSPRTIGLVASNNNLIGANFGKDLSLQTVVGSPFKINSLEQGFQFILRAHLDGEGTTNVEQPVEHDHYLRPADTMFEDDNGNTIASPPPLLISIIDGANFGEGSGGTQQRRRAWNTSICTDLDLIAEGGDAAACPEFFWSGAGKWHSVESLPEGHDLNPPEGTRTVRSSGLNVGSYSCLGVIVKKEFIPNFRFRVISTPYRNRLHLFVDGYGYNLLKTASAAGVLRATRLNALRASGNVDEGYTYDESVVDTKVERDSDWVFFTADEDRPVSPPRRRDDTQGRAYSTVEWCFTKRAGEGPPGGVALLDNFSYTGSNPFFRRGDSAEFFPSASTARELCVTSAASEYLIRRSCIWKRVRRYFSLLLLPLEREKITGDVISGRASAAPASTSDITISSDLSRYFDRPPAELRNNGKFLLGGNSEITVIAGGENYIIFQGIMVNDPERENEHSSVYPYSG